MFFHLISSSARRSSTLPGTETLLGASDDDEADTQSVVIARSDLSATTSAIGSRKSRFSISTGRRVTDGETIHNEQPGFESLSGTFQPRSR